MILDCLKCGRKYDSQSGIVVQCPYCREHEATLDAIRKSGNPSQGSTSGAGGGLAVGAIVFVFLIWAVITPFTNKSDWGTFSWSVSKKDKVEACVIALKDIRDGYQPTVAKGTQACLAYDSDLDQNWKSYFNQILRNHQIEDYNIQKLPKR